MRSALVVEGWRRPHGGGLVCLVSVPARGRSGDRFVDRCGIGDLVSVPARRRRGDRFVDGGGIGDLISVPARRRRGDRFIGLGGGGGDWTGGPGGLEGGGVVESVYLVVLCWRPCRPVGWPSRAVGGLVHRDGVRHGGRSCCYCCGSVCCCCCGLCCCCIHVVLVCMCRVGGGRSWVLEAHWEDRVEARVPVCVQPRRLEDVGDVERRKPAGPNPTKLLARPRLLYDELWLAGRISFLLRKFDFIRFDSGLDNLRLDGDIIIFINPGCFIYVF